MAEGAPPALAAHRRARPSPGPSRCRASGASRRISRSIPADASSSVSAHALDRSARRPSACRSSKGSRESPGCSGRRSRRAAGSSATGYSPARGQDTPRVGPREGDDAGVRLPTARAPAPRVQTRRKAGRWHLEPGFADESTLYSGGYGGVRRWDLASGRQEVVIGGREGWADMIIRPKRAWR